MAIRGGRLFWRVQPKGKSLFSGHRSGLGSEPVEGLFAFEDPVALCQTYTWLHTRRTIRNFEMVGFRGRVIERPSDSEGVVVLPRVEVTRLPLGLWLAELGSCGEVCELPPRRRR